MTRLSRSRNRYQWQILLVLVVYAAVMLLAWPWVGTTGSVALKVLVALAAAGPVLYMIGLMARRIRDSDELEQRTHLVALGTATALVAALSMIGGFLSAAGVLALDGTVLFLVFPVLMTCYGVTRWWVARRYGMSFACDDEGGMSKALYFLLVGVLMGVVAGYAWWRHDAQASSFFCGMAAVFVLAALAHWLRRRYLHRHGQKELDP